MGKIIIASILTALLSGFGGMARAAGPDCPVEGELVHWIADYCMAHLETDDEIVAGDCIADELKKSEKDTCSRKRDYKQALCELARARGTLTVPVEQCVSDRNFAGRTVQHGGVGAR
jgi:hypothetical protein